MSLIRQAGADNVGEATRRPESDDEPGIRTWLASFPHNAPVVVVPVFNAYDDVIECIDSLLAMTKPGTPILVLDDASTDERIPTSLAPQAREQGFAYARLPANGGFVRAVNTAFAWCAPRDVVIVNSDVIVPAEWLERLREAAYFRSNVATATPFTNYGTLVSVPYRNRPVPDLVGGLALDEVDRRIRAASEKVRPIIPTAVGHCTYFRRSALDTVGFFDEAFSPGYGEEVDFSQRAASAGFCHVVADDLFVFHKGSRSFGQESEARRRLQESHDRMIFERYPWLRDWVMAAAKGTAGPLALAVERASAAVLGYRVAIDATCLNGVTTGTQVVTLELIRALATSPDRRGHLSIIVGDGAAQDTLLGVDRLVDEVVRVAQLRHRSQPPYDLIHRPFQVVSANDVRMLRSVARRFIVSHLDCIAYANPSYALSLAEWNSYRRQAEFVFAAADGVTFISNAAAQDAAQHGLRMPPERMCVTYLGVDHHLHTATEAKPPAGGEALAGHPYLLVIGTNFKHKNRVYAIRLLKVLAERYGWPGQLVLAGPSVAWGDSNAEEAQERSRSPGLANRIVSIGLVSEAEKTWLLEHAALVLYPSIQEGFGIVPFEAAAVGTPALTTRLSSLSEVLGQDVLYLDTLDPRVGAETVWALVADTERARRQVEAVRARAAAFTWNDVALRTWEFYARILKLPPRLQIAEEYLQEFSEWGNRAKGAARWARLSSLTAAEHPLRAWLRRMRVGFHVLQTGGLRALRKEIRQYIQWRRSQF